LGPVPASTVSETPLGESSQTVTILFHPVAAKALMRSLVSSVSAWSPPAPAPAPAPSATSCAAMFCEMRRSSSVAWTKMTAVTSLPRVGSAGRRGGSGTFMRYGDSSSSPSRRRRSP
jgi:hypothetical protein